MATSTMDRRTVRNVDAGTARKRPAGPGSAADRRRRRHRWVGLVLAILLVGSLGTGVWLVGFSSVLGTARVRVTGTDVLSADQVRSTAQVPIGLPLARQDLDAVGRRVATLAPVESVRVDRQWPDTVAVDVVERTGVIALRQLAEYAVVDRFGVVFRTAPAIPDHAVLAEVAAANTPALVEVGEVAGALPPSLRDRVRAIRAASPNGVVLVLRNGLQVTWGNADDTALKAQVTLALLEREGKIRHIDVSSPHNPATR